MYTFNINLILILYEYQSIVLNNAYTVFRQMGSHLLTGTCISNICVQICYRYKLLLMDHIWRKADAMCIFSYLYKDITLVAFWYYGQTN